MNEDVLTVLRTVAGLRSAVEGGWLEEISGSENRYQLTDTGRAVLADYFRGLTKMVSNDDQQSDAAIAAEGNERRMTDYREGVERPGWTYAEFHFRYLDRDFSAHMIHSEDDPRRWWITGVRQIPGWGQAQTRLRVDGCELLHAQEIAERLPMDLLAVLGGVTPLRPTTCPTCKLVVKRDPEFLELLPPSTELSCSVCFKSATLAGWIDAQETNE